MGDEEKQPTQPRYEAFSKYYLHPSEGTGTVISPILLRGNNYDQCVRSLRNNLKAKNKLGFIDGTIFEPEPTSEEYEQWGLLMMDPFPSLNIAYAKVATDERHHTVVEAQEARPDNVGFAASGSASGRLVPFGKTATGDESRVCSHCGEKGHEKARCFKLHGYPDWWVGGRGGRTGGRGGRSGGRGGRGCGGFTGNTGTRTGDASSSQPLGPHFEEPDWSGGAV
ncbi:uncharacterized protein [Spinacia oleracea]|uniref:Uncharacterized protein isoform X2 n=1 Tax=Spinacia oleracea TaxID=3562 RepID=A0ABM3QNH2_SPIOL|nr:uncharacterized protein LOC130461050 isoform X2 [Spinacia oleracea]